MNFIDLFAKGQHSSVHVQLTSSVLGGHRQRLHCLSANIISNTEFYVNMGLEGREWVAWIMGEITANFYTRYHDIYLDNHVTQIQILLLMKTD